MLGKNTDNSGSEIWDTLKNPLDSELEEGMLSSDDEWETLSEEEVQKLTGDDAVSVQESVLSDDEVVDEKAVTSGKKRFSFGKKKEEKPASEKAVSASARLPFGKKKEDEKPPLPVYNMKRVGPLVEPVYTEGDKVLSSYWAIEGLCFISLVQTPEYENVYLVHEPALTEFEHALLERLDGGVRDILIVREIAQSEDKRQLLYNAMDSLLKEWGLAEVVSDISVYKIRYYLERAFFGWGRIDALRCD